MINQLATILTPFLLFGPAVPVVQQTSVDAEELYIIQKIRQSHIDGNMPPQVLFNKLLKRDILTYLVKNKLPSRSITVELLRKQATQAGMSYPKYYVWIRAADGTKRRIEGGMRVAAVGGTRFDITDFTPAAAIRADPAALTSIFPRLIIPALRQRAAKN